MQVNKKFARWRPIAGRISGWSRIIDYYNQFVYDDLANGSHMIYP